MKLNIQEILSSSLLIAFALVSLSCGLTEKSGGGFEVFDSDDTVEAIKLIEEANGNLKSIRALYKRNESKVGELTAALEKEDVAKVKRLTDDLSMIINDGYLFAESAKEKIAKAQELNINQDWKEYLRIKELSLEMQIKAFDFRKESAKLFRDKFGGEDKAQMTRAAQTFKKNEENFKKYMAEAAKRNKEADDLAKEVDK